MIRLLAMAEKLTVPRVLRSWRLKSEFQRVLARLPSSVGDVVYHLLQTAKGLTPNPKRNIEFADRVTSLVETATNVRCNKLPSSKWVRDGFRRRRSCSSRAAMLAASTHLT